MKTRLIQNKAVPRLGMSRRRFLVGAGGALVTDDTGSTPRPGGLLYDHYHTVIALSRVGLVAFVQRHLRARRHRILLRRLYDQFD